jgi:hypothetical protein
MIEIHKIIICLGVLIKFEHFWPIYNILLFQMCTQMEPSTTQAGAKQMPHNQNWFTAQ